MRQCKQCGVGFMRIGKGYPVRFCSHDCRKAFNKTRWKPLPKPPRQCVECGTVFTPILPNKQKCCSKPCADRLAHRRASERRTSTCEGCGKTFNPKMSNRLRFCSRECAHGWQSEGHAKERAIRRGKLRLRRLFANLRQCVICNAAFVAPTLVIATCSEPCRLEHRHRQSLQASGYDYLSKPCKACGKEVETTGNVRTFRPSLCRSCAAKAKRITKRRAKRRRAMRATFATAKHRSVDVIRGLNQLIDAAGNQCPCCGLLMSKQADVSSDRALELDHAIPLSRGGSDLFPNLRPMCRKCNGLKRDFTAPSVVIRGWAAKEASPHQTAPAFHLGCDANRNAFVDQCAFCTTLR